MASKPPISGICNVHINTRSKESRSHARTASRPVPATTTLWPRLLQSADHQGLVDGVVLGEEDTQGTTNLSSRQAGNGEAAAASGPVASSAAITASNRSGGVTVSLAR